MSARSPRVVVVGASLSGLRFAEALAAESDPGSILVLGEEPHVPYNRPPLSKGALTKPPSPDAVALPRRSVVDGAGWRLGEPVVAADLAQRQLRLRDGDVVSFDVLVAATGVRPRRLPLPGPAGGRFVLRTVADAAALHPELRPGARVVVVGAGFLGCEVAATAVKLGCRVDVVAIDEEPMFRPFGAEVGAAIRRRHEVRGVRFHLGRGVAAFHGMDRVRGVSLDDGTELDADVVIEAVGSLPNTEWLAGNGLDLSDGVLTDACFRAGFSAPVYAVGDVARFPNPFFDEVPRRIEHWNLAIDTGRAAARSVLAELRGAQATVEQQIVPYFWSDQYELKIQAYGAPGLGTRTELLEGALDDRCAVGYYAGRRLVGVALLGLPRAAMTYRGRIVESAAADGWAVTPAGGTR